MRGWMGATGWCGSRVSTRCKRAPKTLHTNWKISRVATVDWSCGVTIMLLSRSVGFCQARIVCYLKPKLRVRGFAVSKNFLVMPMEVEWRHLYEFFFYLLLFFPAFQRFYIFAFVRSPFFFIWIGRLLVKWVMYLSWPLFRTFFCVCARFLCWRLFCFVARSPNSIPIWIVQLQSDSDVVNGYKWIGGPVVAYKLWPTGDALKRSRINLIFILRSACCIFISSTHMAFGYSIAAAEVFYPVVNSMVMNRKSWRFISKRNSYTKPSS